jgi:chromosome segregation ATPase
MLGLNDFNAAKTALANSPVLRYVLIFVAGLTIGAVFYPTKKVEEKLSQKYEQQISQLNETNKMVTENMQQELSKVQEENKDLQETTTKKINELTTENSQLKSKTTDKYYKIVHPDGTIEVTDVKESDVDQSNQIVTSIQQEYTQKIKDIETKYAAIHEQRVTAIQKDFSQKEQTYQQTIASLTKSKTVSTNPRTYGLEIGKLSNGDYYGHVDMDVVGPIYIGLQTQSNFLNDSAVGAGVGIRF